MVVELDLVAALLEKAADSEVYRNVIGEQRKAVIDPDLTLSAKFLNELKAAGVGSGLWSLNQAKINKDLLVNTQSSLFDDALMKNQAVESIAKQKVVEASDKENFETFLEGYFSG